MSAPIQSTYLAPGQYALGPLPLMSGEPAVCGTQRNETLGSGRCFGGRSLPLRPVFSGGIRFVFSRWLIVFSRPPLDDDHRPLPGLAELGRLVGLPAARAVLVERRVGVPVTVHLRQQPDVGRPAPLGELPVHGQQVAVALALADRPRADHAAAAVAGRGREAEHAAGLGALPALDRILRPGVPGLEGLHHRDVAGRPPWRSGSSPAWTRRRRRPCRGPCRAADRRRRRRRRPASARRGEGEEQRRERAPHDSDPGFVPRLIANAPRSGSRRS